MYWRVLSSQESEREHLPGVRVIELLEVTLEVGPVPPHDCLARIPFNAIENVIDMKWRILDIVVACDVISCVTLHEGKLAPIPYIRSSEVPNIVLEGEHARYRVHIVQIHEYLVRLGSENVDHSSKPCLTARHARNSHPYAVTCRTARRGRLMDLSNTHPMVRMQGLQLKQAS